MLLVLRNYSLKVVQVERKNFQMTDAELRKVNQENLLLKEEKDNLNSRLNEETELLGGQVSILKEEVNKLQKTNEKLRKEIGKVGLFWPKCHS